MVVGLALVGGLVTRETGDFVLIVTATSMLLTPLAAVLARRLAAATAQHEHRGADARAPASVAVGPGHVVIAGFGRVGQMLARILEAQGESYVALDLDGHAVSQCRARGLPVFYGDARRTEILRRAHVDAGRALVVTMDDPRAAQQAVHATRKHWPRMPVYARARDSAHARRLLAAGATDVIPESMEASLQLAARVLEGLGVPVDSVKLVIEREQELAKLNTSQEPHE